MCKEKTVEELVFHIDKPGKIGYHDVGIIYQKTNLPKGILLMMTIQESYQKNPVYTHRYDTDKLFILPAGSASFHGLFDEAIRFVAENQCKNRHNWKLFAEQFKSPVDDENRAWRCEYWGKMMRGASFTYAYTRDPELYDMMVETVRDLLSTEDSLGRISTYSVEHEFQGWDMWGRKYVLLGLQYFLDVCHETDLREQVIKTMRDNLDYILSKIGPVEEGKTPITQTSNFWQGLNSCSILEPVVRLYNLTGEKKYLDFADYIVSCGGIENGNIFELAYEGKLYPYQYPVTKAYEMMSNFEGLMEYYRVTGEEKWRIASVNFGKLVAESDLTIIGSSGCTHELFDHSTVKQANTKNLIIMQETCVTVTWMKFITQVLLLCGEAHLVDKIERSIYNGLFGAINTEHSDALAGFTFDSYSPLLMGTRARQLGGTQTMRGGKEVYGCCVAIGAAGTGLIPSVAVMGRKDGVTVNLYEKGQVNAVTPSGNPLTLSFDTEYPLDGHVTLTLSLPASERFTVALRIPEWSETTELTVNGETIAAHTGYTEIQREWNPGDRIGLAFDMRVRIVNAPDDPEDVLAATHRALERGPLVLARDARLGEPIDGLVDFAADENGYALVRECVPAPFPCHLSLAVRQKDGSEIHVVDYASAGKTWRRDSRMTAWMPTVNYWQFNETKPVKLYLGHAEKYLGEAEGAVKGVETAQLWQIQRDGFFVRLKHADSGLYLSMVKKDDACALCLAEAAEGDQQKWYLTKAVLNRYTLENKLFGLQLYYNRETGGFDLEKPFSEHFVYDTCIWREFALSN